MPRVLFVAGDGVFRKQLRILFNHGSGFDGCLEARDGLEAVDKTKRFSPNLAVLVFSFVEIDGLQLAQDLKAVTPDLPIFLLTTDYSMDTEKKALSCGITAVFSKVDDLAALLANARAVCGIE
jgi:two-component system response regulator YesN